MSVIQIPVGQMEANCYLVTNESTKRLVIIDPGDDAELVIDQVLNLKRESYYVEAILLTHGHFDHMMAALEVQLAFNIPCFVDTKDAFLVNRFADTAKHFLHNIPTTLPPKLCHSFPFEQVSFQVLSTPGHSPGSVSYYDPQSGLIFVGDVIFAQGGVGRTDFSYCSSDALFGSIQTILDLPDETIIYPGHGEQTTVSQAKHFFTSI